MEYLHFFINSCVPSLLYTVRIVLVMQSDNVFIILKHACEQATFWSQKVEFQNVLMSMLISIPVNYRAEKKRSLCVVVRSLLLALLNVHAVP